MKIKFKKGDGVILAAAPFFSSFACLLLLFVVEDQTVKPETPVSMYITMSMNTFLHCIRSVSCSSI